MKQCMKRALLAIALALGATAATAAPVTVNFTFEGFDHSANTGEWPEGTEWWPWAKLTASFTGEDTNGDAVITANELTALTVDNVDYFAPQQPGRNHWFDRFEYRGTNDYLIETTILRYYDEGHLLTDTKVYGITAANQYIHWTDQNLFERYESTSATIVTVTPVPEPATYAMLGAGLVLTGAAVRRRRAARQA